MKRWKKLLALILTMAFVLGLSCTVYAHDELDLDQKGSIHITMRMGNKNIGGGNLTMYRVGDVQESNGDYSFQPSGDFVSCGVSFENLETQAKSIAKELAQYAAEHKLTGVTKNIGMDGKVEFSDLEPGLYLFVQNEAASGYNRAEAFLVTMPYLEDGEYLYEVDASPKVEVTKETEPTPPGGPETPDQPNEPKLPQTGQINWPIPLMAVLGLTLFAVGWMLCFGKRKNHEK